ncbi:MAG TPA: alkaline phosphatase family protein [Actinomycetota bacterium]|nr:alkaline phosphatase family protein [Actinomycetota bacterium]
MPRVLVIGWDGADWRILDPMLRSGALPHLATLVERGGRAVLKSTLPTHSWSAWPSFLTGVDPDDHGVYDILEPRGKSGRQYPVSFRSIRERTFMADLASAGVETIMVNVPLTFPPPQIKGKLIAGGVLPKRRAFTYPESLEGELEAAGAPWPINGTSWVTFRNRPEPLLEEADWFIRARQRACERLLDATDWQVACLVFVETDRVQHCLAKYISPDHPEFAELSRTAVAEKVRDMYRLLDDCLGELAARTQPEDLILFMSDHGMQACTGAVNMDRLLERLGFLEFSASNAVLGPMQWGPIRAFARSVYDLLGLHGKVALPHSVNWSTTKAYTSVRSTGEGISVNLGGREPNGIVDPADLERVRDEVAEAVSSFVDPRTGRSPVGRVWRREEVFKGKYAAEAPDLILEPAPLYSLTHARAAVEAANWLSGDHRVDGVLAAAGAQADASSFPETARLVDLAPTILAAAGAPASVRHSGSVLPAIVGGELALAANHEGRGDSLQARSDLDDAEAEEVEEHLRGLGYLE